MEERRVETKVVRVSKYLAQLTKHGIMKPVNASDLVKRYKKDKNLDAVFEEIIMLPSPEGKESVLQNVINMMMNDRVLNDA